MPALEMLPDLTPELLAENNGWLQKAGAIDGSGVFILCFQSYVVETPHHTILVDSCIGNDKQRPTRPNWHLKTDDSYMRALAAAGFSTGDIDFVMCTHLHPDHVGWNTRMENGRWVPTFPNARYVFGKQEFDYWIEQNAKAEVPAFADSVLPVSDAGKAETVGNDYGIGDHVRILPTPGHTPGHVAFTLGRGRDAAVICGDLMHTGRHTIRNYRRSSMRIRNRRPRRVVASWNVIVTPIRCAAPRIFLRHPPEESAVAATDFPATR
jgi:glyoxylase-like metal-dependent hydrolase (beta-lactamase superfamily II)